MFSINYWKLPKANFCWISGCITFPVSSPIQRPNTSKIRFQILLKIIKIMFGRANVLKLQPERLIILFRNINQPRFCNVTRLAVKKFMNNVQSNYFYKKIQRRWRFDLTQYFFLKKPVLKCKQSKFGKSVLCICSGQKKNIVYIVSFKLKHYICLFGFIWHSNVENIWVNINTFGQNCTSLSECTITTGLKTVALNNWLNKSTKIKKSLSLVGIEKLFEGNNFIYSFRLKNLYQHENIY